MKKGKWHRLHIIFVQGAELSIWQTVTEIVCPTSLVMVLDMYFEDEIKIEAILKNIMMRKLRGLHIIFVPSS
jgi:hypothetical protein